MSLARIASLGFLCVLGASSAFASFEMMLVPNTATDRISRYDPVNQIGLGSYGPTLGRQHVLRQGNRTISYSGANGRFIVHDYSTGIQVDSSSIGVSNVGTFVPKSNGGILFSTGDNILRSLASIGAGALTVTATLFNVLQIQGVMDAGNGYWFVHGFNSAGDVAYATIRQSDLTVTAATFTHPTSDVILGQAAVHVSSNGSRLISYVHRSPTGMALRTMSISSLGTLTSTATNTSLGVFFSTTANSSIAAVSGHNGFYLVGRDSGGASMRIAQFESGPIPQYQGSHTTGTFSNPVGVNWTMSTVVAPEPGTMIALGVGLAALVRSRKGRTN